ncbi:PqqD family protein [Microbacterium sp. Mcb102]|uniref:PqqD family protein n=1 Tax=Microbacterium sp. Mcb102 TaxID=2926012 RepID=UPI0021C6EB65|nr:PqqD family protein [Microbacterium sp. Mcb102]
MSDEVSWRVRPDAAWFEEEERVSVLALSLSGSAAPVILEGTAKEIWDRLSPEHPRATRDLVAELAALAQMSVEDIEADVLGFLQQLRAQRILEAAASVA